MLMRTSFSLLPQSWLHLLHLVFGIEILYLLSNKINTYKHNQLNLKNE